MLGLPARSRSRGCCGGPEGRDTCTRGSGLDPMYSYMDYSYDSCYTESTAGQTERMQKQFAHWRLKRT
jgi:hypothetical protein